MRKSLIPLVLLVSGISAAASATNHTRSESCTAAAQAEAGKLGVAPGDITKMFFDVQQQTGNGDAKGPPDYVAWMSVKQCPKGSLIVQMSHRCYVIQSYTRSGCTLPGVPSY